MDKEIEEAQMRENNVFSFPNFPMSILNVHQLAKHLEKTVKLTLKRAQERLTD